MSKVITFSMVFPAYHPKAGQPTNFLNKIYAGLADINPDFKIPNDANDFWDWDGYYNCDSPKFHTIRAGHRWKVGDKFSPRIWSGKPYQSKQIIIAPDIEIKKIWELKTWDMMTGLYDEKTNPSAKKDNWLTEIKGSEDKYWSSFILPDLAKNDGLSIKDLLAWFKFPSEFSGQVICWNDKTEY